MFIYATDIWNRYFSMQRALTENYKTEQDIWQNTNELYFGRVRKIESVK